MFKKLLKCYIVVLLVGILFLFVNVNFIMASGIVPDEGKLATGDYELNDFIKIAVNVSTWILGITGSLALLMFIYGGMMFLISSGNTEQITKAKQILIGAVIGLVIVFAAYTIIGFTLKAMGLKWEGTTEQPKADTPPPKPKFDEATCGAGGGTYNPLSDNCTY